MRLACAMVLVIDDRTLIDSQAVHPYLAPRNLVPGGYVVVWRPEAEPSQYLTGVHYFGPFPGESESRDWLRFFMELRDICAEPKAGQAHDQATASASTR